MSTELEGLENIGKQPQFTSRSSLISQQYHSRSWVGKTFYRIKRALFARDGFFIIFLIIIILAISTIDWALWKISLNRFHAKHSHTTYTFFVLQLYSGMMLTLSFIAMMLSIHVLKTIDSKQRSFPQSKFVTMSVFDAVCSLCSSMSSASVAGHLQTLLSQGTLPLIMVASIVMLGTRYTPYQVFGAACILTGTLAAAIPGVNSSDESGRQTHLWAVMLYVGSLVPLAIGNTYREYIFRDSKLAEKEALEMKKKKQIAAGFSNYSAKDGDNDEMLEGGNSGNSDNSDNSDVNENTPLGLEARKNDGDNNGNNNGNNNGKKEEPLPQLNIFYLMFWTSFYQFLFSLLAFPILTLNIFGGVAWKDIPLQFVNGARCFAGYHVPELECEIGIQPGVILTTYVLFNFGLCILRLLLIKHGSALLLQITNALALLFSNMIFSWKFIMGEYTEKYNKYDFLGLVLVLVGFVIFQIGVYYKDLEAQREKLFQEALEARRNEFKKQTLISKGSNGDKSGKNGLDMDKYYNTNNNRGDRSGNGNNNTGNLDQTDQILYVADERNGKSGNYASDGFYEEQNDDFLPPGKQNTLDFE